MFSKSKIALLLILGLTAGCANLRQVTQKPGEAPPAPTPTPAAVSTSGQNLTVAFVGDIMMGAAASYKLKTEGPDSFFTYTAPLLKQADIAMGNLEGPLGLTGTQVRHKRFTFLVDPSAAVGLAHAGFTLLTMANNHTMDFGVEALQSTFKALEANGLKHAGAGMNNLEARQPAWLQVKGRKVAVLAYSLTIPESYWASDTRPGCAPADAYEMKEDIQKAKAAGADLVFVCFHWGVEKSTKLRGYQPQLAHLAIDNGADAVVSHHPHIWQGLEVYHGKPIAYAIGNFAFGSMAPIKQSGILYLNFDGKNRWVGGKILPMNVHNAEVRFCPRPMKEKPAEKFFAYLKKLSKKADLKMEGLQINWIAPKIEEPTPTPTAVLLLPTPTPEPGENPHGSVPGINQP